MKLYVDEKGEAPSPRRVRIYLAEKGLDVPLVRMAIHVENRTPEFREKNAISTLPVLELDDGTCISESISICRYFEELHPEPPLFGTTPVEKARVDMWMRRVELYLYLPIEFSGGFAGAEAAEIFRGHVQRSLKFLDGVLAEHRFIVGDDYTIADTFALSAIDFGIRHQGIEVPAKREHFGRWHREVSARPSAKA